MADPKLFISPLSRVVEENGDFVEIVIFRLEHTGWNLEIVASDGCVTVWEVVFQSDEAAFVEAFSVIKDEGVRSFLRRAASKGFRLGNFTQLRWGEVFFAPEQGYPNGRITVTQKGGGDHTIPMTIGIRELLEKLRGNHREAVFTFVSKKTWTNPKNKLDYERGQRYPVTYYGWGSWFKDVVKRSKVENVRTHDLRKTCGSEILNATGNIVAAQKLLGHATVEQTARAYAFLSTDVLLNGMELVETQRQSRHKSGTN